MSEFEKGLGDLYERIRSILADGSEVRRDDPRIVRAAQRAVVFAAAAAGDLAQRMIDDAYYFPKQVIAPCGTETPKAGRGREE